MTIESAHLAVTFHDHQWRVTLNGQPIEQYLAPDGLVIRPGDPGTSLPTCVVELTFAEVEIEADLRDMIVKVAVAPDEGHKPLPETEEQGEAS